MSNKPHHRPGKASATSAARSRAKGPGPAGTGSAPSRTTILVIAAAVAIVVIAAVIIAVVVRGDETALERGEVAECSEVGDPGREQSNPEPAAFDDESAFQPVAVAGEPLAVFNDAIRSGQATDTAICTHAPLVGGYDYDGGEVTIDAASDGATLVVLLAHWCPHCNAEIPELNGWSDDGGVPDGLNVVGVSTSVDPGADNFPPGEWLERLAWQWPALADDADRTAFDAYGGNNFPTMLLIDDDGVVVWRHAGRIAIDDLQAVVDDLFDDE